MKVIALLPVKNEEWCLPAYLHNTLKVVDEIIAIDDGSTDTSIRILLKAGAKVHSSEKLKNFNSGWSEGSIRAELLRLGREAGGTHFVCLDADEAITNPFNNISKYVISKLQPGQKIAMHWLALWKSYTHFRNDATVWSNNWKDFIVADHPSLSYNSEQHMHLGRTPVAPDESGDSNWLRIPTDSGAVMHFQFSAYNNFQVKQAWLRCSELIQAPGTEAAINAKYSITLLDDNVGLTEMPKNWYEGIPMPTVEYDPEWGSDSFARADLFPSIYEYLREYGFEYFENLDIWHIPQLSESRKIYLKNKEDGYC